MLRSHLSRNVMLWLALLLLQVVHAVDPKQLKVRLNEDLLKSSGNVVFGTVLEIDELSTWEDEHIVHLAFQALEARKIQFDDKSVRNKIRKFTRKNPEFQLPTVTTTLVVDDVAYISSSIKGPAFLYNMRHENPPHWHAEDLLSEKCEGIVKDGLLYCQAKAKPDLSSNAIGVGHNTGASCGEVLALLSFCKSGRQPKVVLPTANTKIIAIRDAKDENGKTYAEIAKPCGPEEKKFGCNRLLRYEGIDIKKVLQPGAESVKRELSDNQFFVWPALV